MAERRMFAKSVIESDAFISLPISARLLYYELGMQGDDDGFVNNPLRVMKAIGAADVDLKLLIAKQFIIPFESGVIVIRHWKVHNYIRQDRYKPTQYQSEKTLLAEGVGGIYAVLGIPSDNQMATVGIPSGCIGKGRVIENSIYTISPSGDDTPQSDGKTDGIAASIREIIEYLNAKTGKSFRISPQSTQRHIKARLKEGFAVDDFKRVIDDRCKAWNRSPAHGGQDMRQYLRPETLFGSKFEGYLNGITTSNTVEREPESGIPFVN